MEKSKLIRLLSLLLVLIVGMLPIIASSQNNAPMSEDIRNFILPTDPYCTPVVVNGNNTYPNLPGVLDTSRFSTMPELCSPVALTGNSVPEGVVDWVLVELRSVSTGGDANLSQQATVLARKAGFLLNNGRIVGALEYEALPDHTPSSCNEDSSVVANLDESSSCPDLMFNEVDVNNALGDDDLYIVIRHRNHLDIISSAALTESSGVYTYDFTESVSSAEDGALKANAGNQNRIAMFGGDADLSGSIGTTDYSTQIFPNLDDIGIYLRADTDFSGTIGTADYSTIIFGNLDSISAVRNFN